MPSEITFNKKMWCRSKTQELQRRRRGNSIQQEHCINGPEKGNLKNCEIDKRRIYKIILEMMEEHRLNKNIQDLKTFKY